MRSILIIVVILWFCTCIVTEFRTTNDVNIENLTEILGSKPLFMGLKINGSQSNQTDVEIIDGFDSHEFAENSKNDTFDLNGPSFSIDTFIDDKTNDSIEFNHTVQHSSALVASSRDPVRGIIFRQKVKPEPRSFFGLIIIPYIVCFFAAKGFWPFYPPMLQYQVNEMGKKIFALSDDRVRQFCRGKFNFQETCYRPVWYKGYFVPVDGSTDCPTECPPVQPATTAIIVTVPTPPPTSVQSWGEAPARIAVKSKPSKIAHHQNSDVEVFDTNGKLITTAKPKSDVDEKQQHSNVNIEIHNVFSFGTANNSLAQLQASQQQPFPNSPLSGQTDNKISLPIDNPKVIYA